MHFTKSPNLIADTLPKLHKHWESRAKARTEALAGQALAAHGFTIAVARDAGTEAGLLAREVGKRLDWPVYDHELVEVIAQDLGLRADLLDKVDEKAARFQGFVQEIITGFASGPIASEEKYVRHLVETLVALCVLGDCLIVGRGAAHFLPLRSTLRVRLVAPRKERIAAVRKQCQLAPAEGEQRMDTIDRERRMFVQRHFHKDAAEPSNYDLLVNVARFTHAECTELIVAGLHQLQARTLAG